MTFPLRLPLADLGPAEAPLEPELLEAVRRVMASRRYILGEEVAGFEAELARATGVSAAVGVSSGTDALEACLRTCGVGPGDEVVLPALSFIATAEVVLRVGAEPRFVDVVAGSPHARPAELLAAVTPRTRAVIAVHLFGDCLDLGELAGALADRGVALVEDAAQALGSSTAAGIAAGAQGDCAALSFFPAKPLGGWGDGGAVLTSRAALADRVRSLRQHGRRLVDPVAEGDLFETVGGNWRLDALQAAVLRVKLPRLPSWTAERRRLVEAYDALLEDARLPVLRPHREAGRAAPPALHRYVVRTPARARDALRAHLAARGIETAVYYARPLPLMPQLASLGHRPGDFPAAEAHCREALALPLFVGLSEGAQRQVVGELRRFFEQGQLAP